MRRYVSQAVILLVVASAVVAYGQDAKIGYIDSQRIFDESPEFQEAQAKFDKEVQEWEGQASIMNDEIEKLRVEAEKNSLVWSVAKKKETEDLLLAKQDTLQQFLDTHFGPSGKAERRMAELSKPIRDRVLTIIKQIAVEREYVMVLDAASVSIAFARENLDLTDEVLEEMAKNQ